MTVLLVLLAWVGVSNAAAQTDTPDDPYSTDPLGLIAYYAQQQVHTSGTDRWSVWLCSIPDGDNSPRGAEAFLSWYESITKYVSGYMRTVSDGLYSPTFRFARSLGATQPLHHVADGEPVINECLTLVEEMAAREKDHFSNGALIYINWPDHIMGNTIGAASPGVSCVSVQSCATIFPSNRRTIWVTARATALQVAHEMGHTLHFPHSYSGQTEDSKGDIWEYDNYTDLMSGCTEVFWWCEPMAVNRYAAGWIDSSNVSIYEGGSVTYELDGVIGDRTEDGIKMVVVPLEPGRFLAYSVAYVGDYQSCAVATDCTEIVCHAYIKSRCDPVEQQFWYAIEVYSIDQKCSDSDWDRIGAVQLGGDCWGLQRRTIPGAPPSEWTNFYDPIEPMHHYFDVGETFVWDSGNSRERGDWAERIVATAGLTSDYKFLLTLEGPAPYKGRFSDDEGNIHEADIQALADRDITSGCGSSSDEFCPSAAVTRAQMAAFLVRALGEQPSNTRISQFSDVPADAWYSGYVQRLVELGIAQGYSDGRFGPSDFVTRAQMAVLMVRAFESLASVPVAAGEFVDVPADWVSAASIEGVLASGITKGCATEPSRFCPTEPVRRDQMATFLIRVLDLVA